MQMTKPKTQTKKETITPPKLNINATDTTEQIKVRTKHKTSQQSEILNQSSHRNSNRYSLLEDNNNI